MPTTVVKSIGTNSRDYSTLQSWEDACPADLVAVDQIWKGECYNDSEFTAGVTISGITTDATRYVWLTAAAGQSFQDHATVRSNPLVYDQSKGVGISAGAEFIPTVGAAAVQYTRISRLQINVVPNYLGYGVSLGNGGVIQDCVVQTNADARSIDLNSVARANNCVVVHKTSGTTSPPCWRGTFTNCTVVRPSGYTAGGTAFLRDYGLYVKNCAAFGFSTFRSGSGSSFYTGSYNASDCAADASDTNSTGGLAFANCFESTTNDFRLKSGSPLIDAGNTDATYAPNDISGTARDAGLDGDIGAWEYTSGGGGGGGGVIEPFLRARRPGVTWINDRGA